MLRLTNQARKGSSGCCGNILPMQAAIAKLYSTDDNHPNGDFEIEPLVGIALSPVAIIQT